MPYIPTRHRIRSIIFQSSLSDFTLHDKVRNIVETDPRFNESFLVSGDKLDRFSIHGLNQIGEISFIQGASQLTKRDELKDCVIHPHFLIIEFRLGDKNLVDALLLKLRRFITKFKAPKEKVDEDDELFCKVSTFLLTLRSGFHEFFVVTDSAIESARSCNYFEDYAGALVELQALSVIPKIFTGSITAEEYDVYDLDTHKVNFYKEKKFRQKCVLHNNSKLWLDSRYLIKNKSGDTDLVLHVKWSRKLQKHLIGFVEEVPKSS
jgi:hypothetical protein